MGRQVEEIAVELADRAVIIGDGKYEPAARGKLVATFRDECGGIAEMLQHLEGDDRLGRRLERGGAPILDRQPRGPRRSDRVRIEFEAENAGKEGSSATQKNSGAGADLDEARDAGGFEDVD